VAVAFAINIAVAVAKVLYGELTGSAGMSADGLHSGLDALASVIALIGITLATRPPDPSHPYGYERYESLASLVIGGFLVLALAHILSQAVARILEPVTVQVTWVSFLVMGLSMLASGALSWWERRRGRDLGSELLGADAAHTGSDVLVSASVIARAGGLGAGLLPGRRNRGHRSSWGHWLGGLAYPALGYQGPHRYIPGRYCPDCISGPGSLRRPGLPCRAGAGVGRPNTGGPAHSR
jgi:divalent metal cation (Fe/Co/Zn/Cd) transporter